MPALSLHKVQSAFLHDIYTGTSTSTKYLDQNIGADTMHIYRNNMLFGLTDALSNVYPVLKQILGDACFGTLAKQYIRAYPQSSGNRNCFGEAMPEFIMHCESLASLPYLSDVAGLERAYFQAGIAEDAKPMDFETLTQSVQSNSQFILNAHPSVQIIAQVYNALEIWQAHREQAQQKEEMQNIELKQESQSLVLWRVSEGVDANQVLIRPISPGLKQLIQNCQQPMQFSDALMSAEKHYSDINLLQKEFAEAMHLGMFSKTDQSI